jgi:hypothetical protein
MFMYFFKFQKYFVGVIKQIEKDSNIFQNFIQSLFCREWTTRLARTPFSSNKS